MDLRAASLGLLVALWSLSPGIVTGQAPQQPTAQRRVEVVLDHGPVPRTLRKFWDETDLVVRAVVESTDPPARRGPVVNRLHHVRILDLLKGQAVGRRSPTEVAVRQLGGRFFDSGVEYVSSISGKVLAVASEYVLFLELDADGASYWLAHGDVSVFPVDRLGLTVAVPEALESLMPELVGRSTMPKAELLALLRSFR